ncbi:MAG: hypothetical protein EHM39_00835 [Chloroflexi bacterium]|nr:MAG: hypothetical protein EHM39_00835 [Chloroflexota bacterium]
MTVSELLHRILREPSADDLWQLNPYLLGLDSPEAERARALAQQFYCYLNCVLSKLTSKQYSSLSALLAAGSIGMVVAQDVIQAVQRSRQEAISELLAGGMAGLLEAASAWQHVKAWEAEYLSVQDEVSWHLYETLWQVSVETQPDLPVETRRALVDQLLAPIRSSDTNSAVRVALIIRLFQILLVIQLAPLLTESVPTSEQPA